MPVPLRSKLIRETLKAKSYNLGDVETGKVTIGKDLMRLLENLAAAKPVVSTRRDGEPEFTITRRKEPSRDKNSMKAGDPGNKEMIRTLVNKIPEEKLKQTTLRRKEVAFKEEIE